MKIQVDSLRGMRCAPPTSEQWCGALAFFAGLLGVDFLVFRRRALRFGGHLGLS